MSTPILLAWSGGKDAALTLERLRAHARWRVVGLVTTLDADERVSAHGVRVDVLQRQVEALGLPLHRVRIPAGADNATYERAFAAALEHARADDDALDTIAFGDLLLADVRAWREAQLAHIGWRAQFPLWGEDTAQLARHFIRRGYRAIVCSVDMHRLDAGFCGREFDAAFLRDLPSTCDPCGENGEFHTWVTAGPPWPQPLPFVQRTQPLAGARFAQADIEIEPASGRVPAP